MPFKLLAMLLWLPLAAAAQGFGQNKVQYHSFKWSYYRTEHFNIYFPQGAERIAQFAARHVEEMYKSVSKTVGHRLENRVPIILHNSHAEFEQTNVIPIPLDEGIGGFTESFKNRIVLPFEGSYTEFYHVLQHEMTHAVMADMLNSGSSASRVSNQVAPLPLWMSEGLAEYASLGWDLSSEFFMVDATTFGYVAPPTVDFGGFLAYKGGQLFLTYVDKSYGKGTVTKIIQDYNQTHDEFAKIFKRVTKTSLEEAGELWLRELRFLYWPELGQRKYGKSVARQLTDHGRDLSFFNLQPAISPNGEEIAFFSDRETWEAIFILNIKTEKITRSVIQGGKGGKHESFHSFKSGIAWSPDSKRMAVVSKSGGRDVIHIIDARTGKVRRELTPDVQAILSPSWSRDGRYIAFSGLREGLTDIYVWDLEKNSLRQLTFDLAHDDHPVFSPSGKWIAFETDRNGASMARAGKDPLDGYDSLLKFMDIYKIRADGGGLAKVSGGAYDEKMPSYGPSDSMLIFVSNRSGIDNVYLSLDSAGAYVEKPLTNLLSGCFTPSWSWDGKLMAFSLFEQGGWDVYLMKDPLKNALAGELPKTRFIKALEDSTMRFFRPLNWATLSSYNADSVRVDSLRSDSLKAKNRKDSLDRVAKSKAKADSVAAAKAAKMGADEKSKEPAEKIGGIGSARQPAKTREGLEDSTAFAPDRKKRASRFLTDSSDYLLADGSFRKNKYRPVWSLDNASAALGLDTYYGYGGLAFITLSDLMGDQQIGFALSINGSWQNTNGMVSYDYLALKTDFELMAYHQAQLSQYGLFQDSGSVFSVDSIFLDRQYGVGASASYPFSVYTRMQFDVKTLFSARSREVSQGGDLVKDPTYPGIYINALFPTVSWTHDNSLWGMVGPVNGERFYAGVTAVPPVLQKRFSYLLADTDFRKYWELWKKYTFAVRVSAGMSEALGSYENPHQFWVGGEDFTFNAHANLQNLPRKLEEFYFSQFDFPLRGFDYYEFRGNRKFVSNFEFRYPFIKEFTLAWPIPLSLRYVMGNLFCDYGGAWSDGDPVKQMGMGLGWGMRANLGIFVLKYTKAWSIDNVGTDKSHKNPPRVYWSLGAEF